MNITDMIAQIIGILGMVCTISSYQCKKNRMLCFWQATSGLMFGINFLMIGALGSALFNFINIARGLLLSKGDRVKWKLAVLLVLYGTCAAFSVPSVVGDTVQIMLLTLTTVAQLAGTAAMWTGNGVVIRNVELFYVAPVWIVNGSINFSLGGILSSSFNMISIIVSFIRFGKQGMEKYEERKEAV